ncbi:hypothetical protein D3C77_333570 [compost metagenome]
MSRASRAYRRNCPVLIIVYDLLPILTGDPAALPYVGIIIRHTRHRHYIPRLHFHCNRITRLGIGMQLAGYPVSVQPFQLVSYRLLGRQLHVFINIRMQIIAFLRGYHFGNSVGHVTRINRNLLKSVFATQLILKIQLQAVIADILRLRVL